MENIADIVLINGIPVTKNTIFSSKLDKNVWSIEFRHDAFSEKIHSKYVLSTTKSIKLTEKNVTSVKIYLKIYSLSILTLDLKKPLSRYLETKMNQIEKKFITAESQKDFFYILGIILISLLYISSTIKPYLTSSLFLIPLHTVCIYLKVHPNQKNIINFFRGINYFGITNYGLEVSIEEIHGFGGSF
jgi:hypothetical protein